jgi:hypothetical protein
MPLFSCKFFGLLYSFCILWYRGIKNADVLSLLTVVCHRSGIGQICELGECYVFKGLKIIQDGSWEIKFIFIFFKVIQWQSPQFDESAWRWPFSYGIRRCV